MSYGASSGSVNAITILRYHYNETSGLQGVNCDKADWNGCHEIHILCCKNS